MLFNSIPFFASFLVFYFIYLFLNRKLQNIALLAYGFYFYSYWNWKMSLLLAFSILFNFIFGLYLQSALNEFRRKKIVALGVVLNLLLLGFFKYTIFAVDLVVDFYSIFSEPISIWRPEILLPVGISFYTFHNISYLVEIYKKNINASKDLITFSVYDIFFPLLLAGPIERPNSLLPQLENERRITREGIFQGFSIFVWGIFLKTEIADPLAKYVDAALSPNSELSNGALWFIAPAFAFQVYADFSGYSNCARGLAKAMGFQLMNNFHRPFFATNPVQFWQKWHISLSSWLRDYVYIPLGGNRLGFVRQNLNILIVWVLGGLWHGATYGYLVWGVYLGLCIIFFNLFNKLLIPFFRGNYNYILKPIGLFFTFFSFSFGLLLFRVTNYSEMLIYLRNIFSFSMETFQWAFVLLYFMPILIFDIWQEKVKTLETDWKLKEYPGIFWIVFVLGFLVFSLISPFAKQEFFYFQF